MEGYKQSVHAIRMVVFTVGLSINRFKLNNQLKISKEYEQHFYKIKIP